MNQLPSIVEIIQLMLAPGLMISACGLLLLGMNNKYSLVVNRIRLLNDERRKILHKMDDKDFNYHENVRLASILKQLNALVFRVMLVRNAGGLVKHYQAWTYEIRFLSEIEHRWDNVYFTLKDCIINGRLFDDSTSRWH